MRWVLCVLAFFAVSGGRTVAAVQLLQRDVTLDASQEIHPVTVVGSHGVGTNIRFPDDFEPNNVVCGGQCVVLKSGENAAEVAEREMSRDDPRNWVMEINQEARLISLRPRELPSLRDNPAQAFMTNLFVKLDGGHVVNITLHLMSLRDGETSADGLVNLLLPASATLAGKLKIKTAELEADYKKQLTEGVSLRVAQALGEGFHCRSIDWLPKAHRQDGIVLYLREICSTKGDQRLFWVVFDVANRSNRGVHLAKATLSAVSATQIERIVNQSLFFRRGPLFFGDEGRGVATAAILPRPPGETSAAMLLNKWSLTVETTSGDTIVADDVSF